MKQLWTKFGANLFFVSIFCISSQAQMAPTLGSAQGSSKPIVFTANSPEMKQFKEMVISKGLVKLETPTTPNARAALGKKIERISPITNPIGTSKGGVSDGGGNAVGKILFDFFENEWSFTVSPEQIVNWNSELRHLILNANQMVPMMGVSQSRGLGDELILSIKTRKWILETKEITKESCRNDSMTQSLQSKIVGCQNFYEIRLFAPWILFDADEKNQAALVLHEAVLTWIRDIDKSSSKEDSEFKVREINRLLHSSLNSIEFTNEISKLLPKEIFYNSQEAHVIKSIPRKEITVRSNFCTNNTTDDYAEVMSLFQVPKAYRNANEAFKTYLDLVRMTARIQSMKRTRGNTNIDEQKLAEMRKDYCNNENETPLPDLTNIEFKPNMLSPICKKNVEETFDRYISIKDSNTYQIFDQEEGASLIKMTYALAKSAALFCSGMKGIELEKTTFWPFMTEARGHAVMNETELQAIKYFILLKEDYDKNSALSETKNRK